MNQRTVVIVQARMGSTRLPGKVLLPLAGEPVLLRQIQRIRAAFTRFSLVVATTDQPEDNVIARLCEEHGLACFRGHPTDLLDRHRWAAEAHRADVVVKIPSDCPLIDPAVIDDVLNEFASGTYDFVSNLHPATWPDGNDIEVMTMEALRLAWQEAEQPWQREHTTPYLWEHPERFRVGNVRWETGRDFSMSHRLTLDYPEDYALISEVYEALYREYRPVFSLAEILSFLERRPDVFATNAQLAGVNWYRHYLGSVQHVTAQQTRWREQEQRPV